MPKKYFLINGFRWGLDTFIKKGVAFLPRKVIDIVTQDRPYTGKIRCSSVMNGVMEEYLKAHCDYDVDVAGSMAAIKGTLLHSSLETEDKDNEYSELPMILDDITGQTDLIEITDDEVTLIDYKFYGSWKTAKVMGYTMKDAPIKTSDGDFVRYKTGAKAGEVKTRKEVVHGPADIKELRRKLNIYRYMWDSIHPDKKITKIKALIIPSDGGSFMAKSRGVEEPFYYLDIPFAPDDQVKSYLDFRVSLIKGAIESVPIGSELDKILSNVPDPCNNEESWEGMKCKKYCAVANFCAQACLMKNIDWPGNTVNNDSD